MLVMENLYGRKDCENKGIILLGSNKTTTTHIPNKTCKITTILVNEVTKQQIVAKESVHSRERHQVLLLNSRYKKIYLGSPLLN